MAVLCSTVAAPCNRKIVMVLFAVTVAFLIQAESAPHSKRSSEEKSNLKCWCDVTELVSVSYFISLYIHSNTQAHMHTGKHA